MSDPGTLTAERHDSHIKLTMRFPHGYDHCFMVERLTGTDDDGNEVWEPLHSGTRKFVRGQVDYHRESSDDPDESSMVAPSGEQTYRALAYRLIQAPHVLHTEGVYTAPVTA